MRAILILLLIASAGSAGADTCWHPYDPETAFTQASAVFVGTVESIADVSMNARPTVWTFPSKPMWGRSERKAWPVALEVEFRVREAFKGALTATAAVHTTGPGDCGFAFETGKTYLVHAFGDRLSVSSLTQPKLAKDAGRELAGLRAKR
jgi:hypothetical protein